jgi:hypothetical protein
MKKAIVSTIFLCFFVLGCSQKDGPGATSTPGSTASTSATTSTTSAPSDAEAKGRLTACKSNLKNLATAMEMYSTDWAGKYPPVDTGFQLITPNYLKTIPECSAAKEMTYIYVGPDHETNVLGYEDFYFLSCTGGQHSAAGVDGDFPAYTGIVGLLATQEEYDKSLEELKAQKEAKESGQ